MYLDDFYKTCHPIYQANKNYGITEEWLAGLVSVECSSLDPKASRFEPHVFQAMVNARAGKVSKSFPGFSSGKLGAFIKAPGTRESDLRKLSTSYGLGQIMGYHYFNKWGLLPEKFSNLTVSESIDYTLRMMADGLKWVKNYEELLRWWNTGGAKKRDLDGDGDLDETTYNKKYIPNATEKMLAYKDYLSWRANGK